MDSHEEHRLTGMLPESTLELGLQPGAGQRPGPPDYMPLGRPPAERPRRARVLHLLATLTAVSALAAALGVLAHRRRAAGAPAASVSDGPAQTISLAAASPSAAYDGYAAPAPSTRYRRDSAVAASGYAQSSTASAGRAYSYGGRRQDYGTSDYYSSTSRADAGGYYSTTSQIDAGDYYSTTSQVAEYPDASGASQAPAYSDASDASPSPARAQISPWPKTGPPAYSAPYPAPYPAPAPATAAPRWAPSPPAAWTQAPYPAPSPASRRAPAPPPPPPPAGVLAIPAVAPAVMPLLRPLLGGSAAASTSSAPPPATVATTTSNPEPRLFCFAAMMPHGDELTLMRMLLERGESIFACDAYQVYSSEEVELSPGPPVRIAAQSVGSMHCEYGGPYHLALNTEIFVRIWNKVFADGRYRSNEWTAKVDPDAVFLPERLRENVKHSDPAASVYLNNCDQGLHGPIEVLARGGMETFRGGMSKCVQELQNERGESGEDVFLRHCLGLLHVDRVDDFKLLDETVCFYGDPVHRGCGSGKVSFHPFKHPEEYFKCLREAHGR